MADNKTTKIVEYKIQGNTVDLEKTLNNAIKTLSTMESKLTQITAASRVVDGREVSPGLERTAKISSTIQQIEKMKTVLGDEGLQAVRPDQLSLLNQLSLTLEKNSAKLGTLDNAGRVTNKTIRATAKAMKEATKALRNSGIEAEKASDSWSILKTVLGAAIFRRIARYLWEGYRASIKFVETINLFNVAVKDSSDSLGAFAERLATAYSTDIGPIYQSIAVFRQYANTMGLVSEQADLLSENFTKLSLDLASLYNVSNQEMMNALKSALAGQTRPLMRFGISVHKATLEQTALAHGIEKSWSEMNEAEKVALRYIAVLDQTSSAQGDLARTLESPENQLKIASAQVQIFLRNLGSLVSLVASFVMPVFNGLTIAINKFLQALTTAAGYEIPDYSDNLSENNQMFEDGTDDIEEYEDAVKGLLAPLDEINQAAAKQESPLGEIDPRIAAALEGYDNLMDQISTKTQKFGEIFGRVFSPEIMEGVGKILGVVFETFGFALDTVLKLLDMLSPALGGILNILGYVIQGVAWLVEVALKPVFLWIEGVTSNIWTLIGAFIALNLIMAAVTGSWTSMIAVKAAMWFAGVTKAIILNTAAFIKNTAARIANIAKTIASTIANWWENASLIAKIGLLTLGAGLLVVPIVLAAAGVFSNKANDVPAMATGGVVSSPTFALIGEGRYDEAVMPLGNSPQFKAMKNDISNDILRKLSQSPSYNPQPSRVGGQQTVVKLVMNDREFARALAPATDSTAHQTGVRLRTR